MVTLYVWFEVKIGWKWSRCWVSLIIRVTNYKFTLLSVSLICFDILIHKNTPYRSPKPRNGSSGTQQIHLSINIGLLSRMALFHPKGTSFGRINNFSVWYSGFKLRMWWRNYPPTASLRSTKDFLFLVSFRNRRAGRTREVVIQSSKRKTRWNGFLKTEFVYKFGFKKCLCNTTRRRNTS